MIPGTAFGGLRSVRASWNATVTARSPIARLGGTLTENAGMSVSRYPLTASKTGVSCTSR